MIEISVIKNKNKMKVKNLSFDFYLIILTKIIKRYGLNYEYKKS